MLLDEMALMPMLWNVNLKVCEIVFEQDPISSESSTSEFFLSTAADKTFIG